MNEPNSVAADLLQLTVLAGTKITTDVNGKTVQVPIARPVDFRHQVLTSACTVPHVGGQDLFNFPIPQPQCLIVNYCSLYTTLVDGSKMAVNYGVNADISIKWTGTTNGAVKNLTNYQESQGLVNRPTFLVFQGGQTVALHVSWPAGPTADSIYFLATANCYMADQHLYQALSRYRSAFC